MNLESLISRLNIFFGARSATIILLRNADIGASLARGGDIDCLTIDIASTESHFIGEFGEPLFRIRRSYLLQMFYPWGHIDVTDRIVWREFEYLSTAEVFKNRIVLENGLGIPCPIHEAIICWMASLLWGGFTKDRYKEFIHKASLENGESFVSALLPSFGPELSRCLVKTAQTADWAVASQMIPRIRRRIAKKDGVLSFVLLSFRYYYSEILLRIYTPLPIIALLGPDGAGKSSVLTALKQDLTQAFSGFEVFHWRPDVLPDVGTLLKQRESSKTINSEPHARLPHNRIVSAMRIFYYLADYWIGYIRIRDLLSRGKLILFDRYAYDMAIDPRRYRFDLPKALLHFFVRLAPRPNLVFCLDAPAEILQQRKQEVSMEETARQRLAYQEFVTALPNGHVINASRPKEEVAHQVRGILFSYLARRSART